MPAQGAQVNTTAAVQSLVHGVSDADRRRVLELEMPSVIHHWWAVYAIANVLNPGSGDNHPDPGGWGKYALSEAIDRLGDEIARLSGFDIVKENDQ